MIGFLWVIKMGHSPTKLTYSICCEIPKCGVSHLHGNVPGHVDVAFELIHPDLGHSEGVPSDMRGEVLGVRFMGSLYVCDASAGQDLDAAATLPHLIKQGRERGKVTHPHQYTWEIRLRFCFISFPPLILHSFPLSHLSGCCLGVGWSGRAAVAFVACRDGDIYRLNHSCSCLYHLCSLVWRESSCRNRLTSWWPGVWASVHDD